MGARRHDEDDDVGHLLSGAQPSHWKAMANIIIEIALVGNTIAIPAIAATKIDPGEGVLTPRRQPVIATQNRYSTRSN
jgi:hypothetical protein